MNTNKAVKRKRIESLYVLKAICAFFVIAIHIPSIQQILVPFAGVATPCFLSITGYLLYSASHEREMGKCKAWALKSFRLAVMCNIIYAVVYTFVFDIELPWSDWDFYFKIIFLGIGISGFLWYLTALFEALLLLYLIIKYCPKLINFLPLLYIVAFIIRTFEGMPDFDLSGLFFHPTALRNTCILTSLPFLATGYLIHKHQEKLLKSINLLYAIPITLVSLVAEFYIRKDHALPSSYFILGTYPLVIFLMLACIRNKDFDIPVLGYIGKKHSPNIYYFHGLFIMFLMKIPLPTCSTYYLVMGVYLACLPCSFVFNYINEKWHTLVWQPLTDYIRLKILKRKAQY